jgi:hypothetical protein
MSKRKVYRSQTEYRKSILTNAAIVTVISLIPGLKISVDGFRDEQNRLVADIIMFFLEMT